jgi:hypothetical protein
MLRDANNNKIRPQPSSFIPSSATTVHQRISTSLSNIAMPFSPPDLDSSSDMMTVSVSYISFNQII